MPSATPAKKSKPSQPKKSVSFSIPSYRLDGAEGAAVSVSEEIFGVSENKQLLSQYVYVYNTNNRQGTVSAKTRAEVIGTTKKMYRQKGTGRARHGTKKASLFVGGGVTFGPKPREFKISLNKKQKRKALFMSLSLALKNGGVAVLSGTDGIKPKTSVFAAFLKKNKLDEKKNLVVFDVLQKNNLLLSVRNLEAVKVTDVQSLNAYDVLNAQQILFLEPSVKRLETHFLKKS